MKDDLKKSLKKSYFISGFAVLIIALVLIFLSVKNIAKYHLIHVGFFYFEPAVFFAVPLFFLILVFAVRGKFWAYMLWLGFLFYFLHFCYISDLLPYKDLTLFLYLSFFLILCTFVLELKSINPTEIAEKLKDKIPRKATVAFLILGIITIIGPLLLSLYFQLIHIDEFYADPIRIHLYYERNAIRNIGFLNFPLYLSFNPIVDLGFLLPLYIIIIYQLIRKKDWGYILAPIVFIKSAVPLFSVFHYDAVRIIYFGRFLKIYSSFIQIVVYGFSVVTTKRFPLKHDLLTIKLLLFMLFTLTAAGLTLFFLIKLRKAK